MVLKLLDLKSPLPPPAQSPPSCRRGFGMGVSMGPPQPFLWSEGAWRPEPPPVWERTCGVWGPAGPFASVRPPGSPALSCCPQAVWKQVLVLGLDGAGKSSVLHYICSQKARTRIPPTLGFNSAQLHVEGLEMDLLEGKAPLPPVGTQQTRVPPLRH